MTTINLVVAETCTTVWSRSHSSYCKVMLLRDLYLEERLPALDKVTGKGFPKSIASQLSADVYLQDF